LFELGDIAHVDDLEEHIVRAGALTAPSSAGCQIHEDFAKETASFCPDGITPGTDTDFFLGTASTAISCGALRTFPENGPPFAGTSFQITRRIDCSGLIQGPPDWLHPGELNM
jgi:hypothetical protein